MSQRHIECRLSRPPRTDRSVEVARIGRGADQELRAFARLS